MLNWLGEDTTVVMTKYLHNCRQVSHFRNETLTSGDPPPYDIVNIVYIHSLDLISLLTSIYNMSGGVQSIYSVSPALLGYGITPPTLLLTKHTKSPAF